MNTVKLKDLPWTPNCVATYTNNAKKKMDPLTFSGDPNLAKDNIKKIVSSFPRTELVGEEENYLHFTFKSKLIGYIDDVEFLIDKKESLIHFRSASRVGIGDRGVNRKRMEKISCEYIKSLK